MNHSLRYDGQVVVITGAGNGLGKQYALFFGARGAKVVVNDLGGAIDGAGKADARVADLVVNEIKAAGGDAVSSYDPVQAGDKIIETAIKNFGRVDVLVNNAGILRDTTLRNMKDADWDIIMDVHVYGAMKTTRAAWKYFKKNRYGRVIHTTSASGLFGNFGQSNYAAAKVALVGITEALAKEGAPYNIYSNTVAPAAGSRLTQTVWPKDMMDAFAPEFVVPLVGLLTHSSSTENGSIFEAGAGHYSKIRWERSRGYFFHPSGMSAAMILQNHLQIVDYTNPVYPSNAADAEELLLKAESSSRESVSDIVSPDFKDKTILIAGASNGLARSYARRLANAGAKLVINDAQSGAQLVNEITSAGGVATALTYNVEEGEKIIESMMDTHGRIDIVVNNCSVAAYQPFEEISESLWLSAFHSHLRAAWKIARAAFPIMIKQRYGRIINITSASGRYGQPNQSAEAAAACGIVGFTKTIAREGAKYNICVNAVATLPGAMASQADAVGVAPLVLALACSKPPASGEVYEAGNGWIASARWHRARGADFEHAQGAPSVEELAKRFGEICDFNHPESDHPDKPGDGSKWTMINVLKNPKMNVNRGENVQNRRYIQKIQQALTLVGRPSTYTYSSRDLILYNLGIGASSTDLPLVYEGSAQFHVIPTFSIVPSYFAELPFELKHIVPNFDHRRLLHGEQYSEIKKFPIPVSGTLSTTARLLEVVDKTNAAVIRRAFDTRDASGDAVFYNEVTTFARGSGGWGGAKQASDRGMATATNHPPSRKPDRTVTERTSIDQAALFRLMGDYNALHIDPAAAAAGGFQQPIAHGLATFGVTGKHVYQAYGPFRKIKVRFAGIVIPGQTIVTEMWKADSQVVFRAHVKETGQPCITNAAVSLISSAPKL